MFWRLAAVCCLAGLVEAAHATTSDFCAAIANLTWVSPQDVRACFTSFPVDPEIKSNIIEVINKTLAFHTSVNYQLQAPPPFSEDIHEDVLADLARISNQAYSSDFDLHFDLSQSLQRLNDGHCVYLNLCYDSLFSSFLPIPIVLLTDDDGEQYVHIAPEAFEVATAEFGSEIEAWQDALPGKLRGKLSSLSGARVLSIDGHDPFDTVNENAEVAGRYQGFGTRQNMFFSSYIRTEAGWGYWMGHFAQQSLPLIDSVNLTIILNGSVEVENITLPYRSRISPGAISWNDSASFRENNCVANNFTNGIDLYATLQQYTPHQQVPLTIQRKKPRKHFVNADLDVAPLQDVDLPRSLVPSTPLNGSAGVAQFFMLNDTETGVLMLGSFSARSFDELQKSLLDGLLDLKERGARRLIVDVTNNGGGYICIAHWLHRIIAGPKPTTIPQAGLSTETRAGPLAQLIVEKIVKGADPDNFLLYNPLSWESANNIPFPASLNWLRPPIEKAVNGRVDAFSQRLGDECQPFEMDPPSEPLFDTKKVAIVSNGRCGSSCSLFSITMSKLEGATTVVVGGKVDVRQQYCGTVGGQSTHFSEIDTEIKTAGLKNHSLAPPDFKTNSIQGITWRLGFGIDNPAEPEEWQDHPADINLPLTADIVNKPEAIWEVVAKVVL